MEVSPDQYEEYDFLSNVSIRHIKNIFIGLPNHDSVDIWNMPWIRIAPRRRLKDGTIELFSIDLITLEVKPSSGEMAAISKSMTSLVHQKNVGVVNLKEKSVKLSSELADVDQKNLKPLFDSLKKIWDLSF